MAGPPSGSSMGGSSGGHGSLGFLSCIIRFLSELHNTPDNAADIEPRIKDFQLINSSWVTVEMCSAAYDRQPYLYQHEIFQPLELDSVSLPSAAEFEDGEQPVNQEYPCRGVEGMCKAMDPVEQPIGYHSEDRGHCEPLEASRPPSTD